MSYRKEAEVQNIEMERDDQGLSQFFIALEWQQLRLQKVLLYPKWTNCMKSSQNIKATENILPWFLSSMFAIWETIRYTEASSLSHACLLKIGDLSPCTKNTIENLLQ